MEMYSNLQNVEYRYEEINAKLSDPSVINNNEEYRKLMKEHSDLEDIVFKFRELKKLNEEISEANELLESTIERDFREMVVEELELAKEKYEEISEELKVMLLPKDPNDERSVIVEIRGGAGGEEAALFAGVLFRLYSRYAERNQWRVEILNINETELGGIKEIVFAIEAKGDQ